MKVQHTICQGCPRGQLKAELTDRNNEVREAGARSLGEAAVQANSQLRDNLARAAEHRPGATDAFQQLEGMLSAKVNALANSAPAAERVVCDGPSRFGGCGAKSVPA